MTATANPLGARIGIAATLVLIAAGLVRAFGGPLSLYPVTLGAASVLIAAGYQRINPKLRTTSLMLFVIGLLALPFAQAPLVAIQRGVFVAGMLIALTAGVLLIAHCAMQSDRIHLIGAALRERQGSGRYLSFALVSQFFSGMLGLAGANLMFIMAAPHDQPRDADSTDSVVSVARGFAAASCWSPVFGSMAILLALYPTLHWIQVFPLGLVIGQVTILVGALMFWAGRKGAAGRGGSVAAPSSLLQLARASLPLVASLLALFAAMIVVSTLLHVIVTAALVMLAPLVSLLFHAFTGQPGRRGADALRGLGHGVRLFPTLASEAVLFIAAGCAGSIMADAFPAAWVSTLGQLLGSHHFFAHLFLLFAMMVAALAGIHPVLSGVFLASTMTPAVLGLPPLTHMGAILAGWGLSSAVAPFSVVSLTASRYSGEGLYQISLIRNGAFAVVNSFVICGLLALFVELAD
jgi:hypothetical protein